MDPLTTYARLALVAAGVLVLLAGRRSWFIGTRMLCAVLALSFIATAIADVVLWWPN